MCPFGSGVREKRWVPLRGAVSGVPVIRILASTRLEMEPVGTESNSTGCAAAACAARGVRAAMFPVAPA